jgi:hypothetical protein
MKRDEMNAAIARDLDHMPRGPRGSAEVMDTTPNRLTQRAVDLLGASPLAWSTVSGTLHSLYEEDVTHPDASSTNMNVDEEFGRLEGTYRFWATSPLRRRVRASQGPRW